MNYPPTHSQYPGQQHGTPGGFPQQGYGQPAYAGAPGGSGYGPGPGGSWAIKRSTGRVLLWSILTFGVYGYFYFYTYQKALDQQLGQDTAVLRTVLFLVPFGGIYSIYKMWEDINRANGAVGGQPFNTVALMLICLIPFGIIYSYVTVHGRLMEYFDRLSQGQATDSPYTGGEKAVIGVGLAILLGYIVLMILIFALAATVDTTY